MKVVIEQCNKVKHKAEELSAKNSSDLKNLKTSLQKANSALHKYQAGWAGQWMNENFNHYYENFNPNAQRYWKLDIDDVKEILKDEADIDIAELSDSLRLTLPEYKSFKEFIISELSFLKEIEKFSKETNLLEKIEELEFGASIDAFNRNSMPKSFIVGGRGLDLMNRGRISVPPHIAVESEVLSYLSQVVSIEEFDKLVHRLLRQVEIKLQIGEDVPGDFEKLKDNLLNLFEKFHLVARHFRNRHNRRETLTIKDEYDVQDLVHALLRLSFDDVRAEEYVPSYAGSASRVDFLLKKERTLIEIKKTRSNLRDKELGDQLILDIAKYKLHPDCDRLVCFVYDPEGLIDNPRGLELDLEKNSSENLLVEVYIKP